VRPRRAVQAGARRCERAGVAELAETHRPQKPAGASPWGFDSLRPHLTTTFLLVPVVLVTGMSGTGKSTALAELARRGHRVVDTDYGGWTEGTGRDRVWREDRMRALLDDHGNGALFVSGCVPNQGRFYPRFDAIVLLSAPADVILERVAGRETNDYGKTDAERAFVLEDLAAVEPLLRAGATTEIDTRTPLDEVVDALERIAGVRSPE
jgi:broad-specificity NMP kinase